MTGSDHECHVHVTLMISTLKIYSSQLSLNTRKEQDIKGTSKAFNNSS